MAITQWDIYWVNIRRDQVVGSEQADRRPYVVVSRNLVNSQGRIVVGVPLSSKTEKACAHRILIPVTEISRDPGRTDHITDSVALTDQVRVLAVERLEIPRLGRLSQTAAGAVELGLAYLFDIK